MLNPQIIAVIGICSCLCAMVFTATYPELKENILMKLFNRKNKSQAKVDLGNLYDVNKTLMKELPDLTLEELELKKEELIDFINGHGDEYFMLLCNDRKDYTIFNFMDRTETGINNGISILLDECLPNRGTLKSIALTEDQNAIEIWILINNECFCYYLFPYDLGVIECI